MTTTPPEPPPAAPKDDAAPLGQRVEVIEAEQQRQGGVLDKIVGLLGDREGDATVTTATDPAAPADMAEQMRQAVRDVQAESDAELGRQQRLGGGRRPEPETPPREVLVKGKARLQRALFGGDPK